MGNKQRVVYEREYDNPKFDNGKKKSNKMLGKFKVLETLAEYFTWKGEAIHEINRTENYKRLKDKLRAIITTETTNARLAELAEFTHWYYFERVDGVKLPIENYRDRRFAALQKEQKW